MRFVFKFLDFLFKSCYFVKLAIERSSFIARKTHCDTLFILFSWYKVLILSQKIKHEILTLKQVKVPNKFFELISIFLVF